MIVCAVAIAQPARKTDRELADLKGPVKSVSVHWKSDHKDDYGQIDERDIGGMTYDASGNLIVDRHITPDFIKDKRPERMGPNATFFRSVMGNSVEHYTFDNRGNITQLETWYGDKAEGPPSFAERMKYDSAGRVTERESVGPDGKQFALVLFSRDSAGNVVVEEDRSTDAKAPYPRMHYTHKLDPRGNWIERDVTRENVGEDSYHYRYAGNLFRTITYYGAQPAKSK